MGHAIVKKGAKFYVSPEVIIVIRSLLFCEDTCADTVNSLFIVCGPHCLS